MSLVYEDGEVVAGVKAAASAVAPADGNLIIKAISFLLLLF